MHNEANQNESTNINDKVNPATEPDTDELMNDGLKKIAQQELQRAKDIIAQAKELGKNVTLDPRDTPSGKDFEALYERGMGQFLHDLDKTDVHGLAVLSALHDHWNRVAEEIVEFIPESDLIEQAIGGMGLAVSDPVRHFINSASVGWYLRGKYEEELARGGVPVDPGTSVRKPN